MRSALNKTDTALCLAPGVWITSNFLKPAECQEILGLAEALGFRLASQEGRHKGEVEIIRTDISNRWADRLSTIDFGTTALRGTRYLFQPHFEVYQYIPDQIDEPHLDIPVPIQNDIRSTHTFLVYLQDECVGGSTDFPDLGISIPPVRGSALLFDQSLIHAGARVVSGVKCIVRASVAVQLTRSSGCDSA